VKAEFASVMQLHGDKAPWCSGQPMWDVGKVGTGRENDGRHDELGLAGTGVMDALAWCTGEFGLLGWASGRRR
jgi:hypothetical protein